MVAAVGSPDCLQNKRFKADISNYVRNMLCMCVGVHVVCRLVGFNSGVVAIRFPLR